MIDNFEHHAFQTYDEKLAETAQKWADICTFGHDDAANRNPGGYGYVGQNMAGSYTFKS